jgi:hypothetical protein
MKVFVFKGEGKFYGFALKNDGSDLDPTKGPWSLFKAKPLDMKRGETGRIGVSTDDVLDMLEAGKPCHISSTKELG